MDEVDANDSAGAPQPSLWLRWCGIIVLKVMGWQLEGARKLLHKYASYLVVAAPHTSNWDGVIGIFSLWASNIQPTIIVKKEVIDVPLLGWFFTHQLGVIGLDRQKPLPTLKEVIRRFHQNRPLVVVITPEGTRRKTDAWKPGFYFVAQKAHVPILLAYIDYERKRAGIAPFVVMPTGDMAADMRPFRDFLAHVTPKYPAQKGEI